MGRKELSDLSTFPDTQASLLTESLAPATHYINHEGHLSHSCCLFIALLSRTSNLTVDNGVLCRKWKKVEFVPCFQSNLPCESSLVQLSLEILLSLSFLCVRSFVVVVVVVFLANEEYYDRKRKQKSSHIFSVVQFSSNRHAASLCILSARGSQ